MPQKFMLRPFTGGLVLAVAAATLSGCGWFRLEPLYLESRESRPLEVPPDLVLPASSAALQIPPAAAGAPSPGEAPPLAFDPAAAFEITDNVESAFRRVGLALGRIEGVSATPIVALSSHEVSFNGENFLIRLGAQGVVVRIDAISPDGRPLSGGAAGELLDRLRARLQ